MNFFYIYLFTTLKEPDQDIENSQHLNKGSSWLFPISSLSPQVITVLSGCFIQHYTLEIPLYLCKNQKFIILPLLCTIPVCEYATIYLPFLLLIAILVVHSLGLS